MSHADLLIEIGSEELPPKALKRLGQALGDGIVSGLQKQEIEFSSHRFFATPRRLAVYVEQVQVQQGDKEVERRGPALKAAFDEEGCATPAAKGFAQSCGVTVEDLDKIQTKKGAWLVFRQKQAGRATTELLPDVIAQAVNSLPIPKRMRWGNNEAQFVRPVHWLVALFGHQVLDISLLTVKAGNTTYGHRFHHPRAIHISEAEQYAPLLESEGRVMADFSARRAAIKGLVEETAKSLDGVALSDDDLLDEVTGLVEWPVVVVGSFDPAFLDVPAEALVAAMKGHQKYFPLTDKQGKLLANFITISNIESVNPQEVKEGNERVIRPRLEDAQFFWQQDKKHSLTARRQLLKGVVYQEKLGSLYDKTQRVADLAAVIAKLLKRNEQHARLAGELCKSDLLTEMVGEFPELQGVMGRYYAQHEGLPNSVALALDQQYQPRYSGDDLPDDETGQCLALAERIDSLVGLFAAGQSPTGEKDPFALRRSALGVLRILIEKGLDLDLYELLRESEDKVNQVIPCKDIADTVFDFMLDRLKVYYQEQGIALTVFNSVRARQPRSMLDFQQRLFAVQAFRELAEAESLSAANKRIGNILKKSGSEAAKNVDENRLVDEQEKSLYQALRAVSAPVNKLITKRKYTESLKELAGLRSSVDDFFDHVMVMVDDDKLRANRLALLAELRNLFLEIADLSCLQE